MTEAGLNDFVGLLDAVLGVSMMCERKRSLLPGICDPKICQNSRRNNVDVVDRFLGKGWKVFEIRET